MFRDRSWSDGFERLFYRKLMNGACMSIELQGGCLCGQVRFTVVQTPIGTFACHCTFCQRITGSSFFAESIFPENAVRFNEGRRQQYEHRSDTSGKKVFVHFCPSCGSTLGLTFERWPDIRGIARGCLDDPSAVEITSHIWTRSAQTGIALPAHVDCFTEARASLDGQPAPALRHLEPVVLRTREAYRKPNDGPLLGV